MRAYASDLRWRIIFLSDDGYPPHDIAEYLYVHPSTVRRVLRVYKKWGCVKHPFRGNGGRKKLLAAGEMKVC